ncbi:36575_t:CDS:1, partial [Racocetra persica]
PESDEYAEINVTIENAGDYSGDGCKQSKKACLGKFTAKLHH